LLIFVILFGCSRGANWSGIGICGIGIVGIGIVGIGIGRCLLMGGLYSTLSGLSGPMVSGELLLLIVSGEPVLLIVSGEPLLLASESVIP
jgi:hypothetical protein